MEWGRGMESMRPAYRRCVPLAALLLLLALAACGSGASTTNTFAPTPGAARPPAPAHVPSGWAVAYGPHFSIAHPADWVESRDFTPASSATAGAARTRVWLSPPGGRQTLLIAEDDNADSEAIQSGCAIDQKATVAGLRVSTFTTEGGARNFGFYSDNGTIYTLVYLDPSDSPAVRRQEDAIFATFHPEFASPAC